MFKIILFLAVLAFTKAAVSIIGYPVTLPNSSYTITGISYIQNTNWVQIAISGPGSGYTELYNITNATATKISS